MDTIKSIPKPITSLAVDFSWTPVGQPVTYLIDGQTYSNDSVDPATLIHPPVYLTPVGEDLTFTATVDAPEGIDVVEYHWRFGDGTEGYGATIDHTYHVPSPQTRCVLTVLDTLNRPTIAAHQMLLVPSSAIQISSLQVRG